MESEENQEISTASSTYPDTEPTETMHYDSSSTPQVEMLDQLKALRLVISKTMLFRTMYTYYTCTYYT